MAPAAISAARSCVAGRSTRSDRQVPPAATGGSTACSRTAEPAGADAGQLAVHPGLRVVEAPAGCQRQPLRQPAHRGLVGESDVAAPQPVSVVDPYRVRTR